MIKGIEVQGLREFAAKMRTARPELAKELKVGLNDAAEIVVNAAEPKVPHLSGNLARTLRATSTPKVGKVTMGKSSVPYAGFIEFGGAVGRNRSVRRPRVPQGRYLLPAYEANRARVQVVAEHVISEVARKLD